MPHQQRAPRLPLLALACVALSACLGPVGNGVEPGATGGATAGAGVGGAGGSGGTSGKTDGAARSDARDSARALDSTADRGAGRDGADAVSAGDQPDSSAVETGPPDAPPLTPPGSDAAAPDGPALPPPGLDAPVTQQPDAPVAQLPDAPVTQQPDAPVTQQPDAPVTQQPDAPVAQPDAPVAPDTAPPKPDAPPVAQMDTAAPKPDAPAPDTAPAGPVTAAQLLALASGCAKPLSHFYDIQGGTAQICGLTGAVFWTADMDIDCDGRPTAGKCDAAHDVSYLPDTAVHNLADQPLAAAVTPYVVIPNDFKTTGLKGGAVTAVIYKGQLLYAVFGDTGPDDIIGEASYAAAAKLGIDPDARTGGVGGKVVTYITFTGTGTVPKDVEDQAETQRLGAGLAAKLLEANR